MELYNIELEQAILGTVIINSMYFDRDLADIMKADHFYEPANRVIWERIEEGIMQGVTDGVILKTFFQNNEVIKQVGGASYLATLLSRATGVIDIRDYAREVRELWQKRQLRALIEKSMTELGDKSFDFIAGNLENEMLGLMTNNRKKKTKEAKEIIKQIKDDRRIGLSSKVIPTGFKELDKVLNGGIRSKYCVVIGGRAGIGKTTIAQNIILSNAKAGKTCLFISMEMTEEEVIFKFCSNLTSISSAKLQDGYLDQSEQISRDRAERELEEMRIFINDSPTLRIGEINRIIKMQLEKTPVDMVFIDYIQIIRGDDTKGKNEAQIIKENTTALAGMAKQYDVAIVALAQINRNGAEAPKIQDLKGSGGIEEDAHIVILIHRDVEKGQFLNSGSLIVAKNRRGRTCEIPICFDGEFGRFAEDL